MFATAIIDSFQPTNIMIRISIFVAILSFAYYLYITPNVGLEPTVWKNPHPLSFLEINNMLHFTKILYNESNDVFIPGPESFAFDENTGTL